MEAFIAAFLLGTGWLLNKARPVHTVVASSALPDASGAAGRDVYQSHRFRHVWEEEQRRARAALTQGVNQDQRRLEDRGISLRPTDNTMFSSLLGKDMPLEHFEHNNMVPFYSGSADAKQPSRFAQNKLEMHTGVDVNLHEWGKKAAVEIWKPSPQGQINSSGRVQQDYDRDAQMASMQVPRNRANERPAALQPQVVGRPGVVGAGWVDTRSSVSYKTVDDMRTATNPKVIYEGRFGGPPRAMNQENMAPTQHPKVAPPRRPQSLRSTMMAPAGTGVFKEETRPADYRNIRDTERQSTDLRSAHVGPAGKGSVEAGTAAYGSVLTRVIDPFKQMLGSPSIGPGVNNNATRVSDHCKNSAAWSLYGNNRDETQSLGFSHTKANIATNAVKKPTNQPLDVARTTLKESTEDSARVYGIATGPEKLTMHDANDVARTTRKETMIHNSGNLHRNFAHSTAASQHLVYNPNEWAARVTNKQVSTYNSERKGMGGNVGGSANAVGEYQNEYNARVTQRQTIDERSSTAYGVAAGDDIGGYMSWPAEAKATQKEALSAIDRYGVATGMDANTSRSDVMNMTIRPDKEDVIFERAPAQEFNKVAHSKDQIGQGWYKGNADLQAYTRMPAHCGDEAQRLPPNAKMLSLEGLLNGRKIDNHHDPTEKGVVDQRKWTNDAINANRAQLRSNPYTVTPFHK
jgi:hypothetical protein